MMQTIETKRESAKDADLALIEDLERRYGPAMAQEIVDQLKRAEALEASGSVPDCLSVKAMSEAEEIYRQEARIILKRLRAWKRDSMIGRQDVLEFEGVFLGRELERTFGFYLRFNKGFHVLYRQAMQAYKVKAYVPAHERDQNNIILQAA